MKASLGGWDWRKNREGLGRSWGGARCIWGRSSQGEELCNSRYVFQKLARKPCGCRRWAGGSQEETQCQRWPAARQSGVTEASAKPLCIIRSEVQRHWKFEGEWWHFLGTLNGCYAENRLELRQRARSEVGRVRRLPQDLRSDIMVDCNRVIGMVREMAKFWTRFEGRWFADGFCMEYEKKNKMIARFWIQSTGKMELLLTEKRKKMGVAV